MANPRYTPREPSRREQRLNEYSQFQEGAQRQQALNADSQASMMQQLMQMYGLQQQTEMDPLRMEALRASTEAQGLANEQQRFQNDWAQPNAMAAYDLAQAQAQGLQDRASGEITPRDRLRFLQETGQEYVSPEEKAVIAQKAEAQRQAAILADSKQQAGPAPLPPIGQRPAAPPDPGATWGDIVKGLPGAFTEKAIGMHKIFNPWVHLNNLLKKKAY